LFFPEEASKNKEPKLKFLSGDKRLFAPKSVNLLANPFFAYNEKSKMIVLNSGLPEIKYPIFDARSSSIFLLSISKFFTPTKDKVSRSNCVFISH
jgi:hypothetical protein